MSNGIHFGSVSQKGINREANEDNFAAVPTLGLWLVADGMGGHESGEIASKIAVETIQQEISSAQNLVNAVEAAHHAVLQAAAQGLGNDGMGTTVVCLRLQGAQYEIAWVGDSRAYLWNGERMFALTRDHSIVQRLYEAGAINESELHTHPQRNFITQAIGAKSLKQVQVDRKQGTLHPGHRIVLCSDGLTGAVTDQQIEQILDVGENEQNTAEQLAQLAVREGSTDDITIVVVGNATSITSEHAEQDNTVPMDRPPL